MRHLTIALVLLVFSSKTVRSADDAPAAINRSLKFLGTDALAWKKKHNCVSCHHAALVVWSMQEAKQRGHSVDEPVLAELTKWLAESGNGRTGAPRPPGIPKALNTGAVWFALALGTLSKPDAVAQNGLKLFLNTVKSDQTENGAWSAWPQTRPPIFGRTDESVTLLATLAVLPAAATGDDSAKAVRDKGVQWLARTKTDDDPQSTAMRLVLWKRLGRPEMEWQPLVQLIKARQNADGGWSQARGMASDAWATGQALYALAESRLKPDDPALKRGQVFLIKTQRPDGSWAMISRPCPPSGKGSTSLIPITGAGTAWGTMGLVRSSRNLPAIVGAGKGDSYPLSRTK